MHSLNRKTYLDVGQISIFMQIKFAAQGTNERQLSSMEVHEVSGMTFK